MMLLLQRLLTADFREQTAETAENSAISSDSEAKFTVVSSHFKQSRFYVGNVVVVGDGGSDFYVVLVGCPSIRLSEKGR